jgi:hypothetical protein
LRRLWHALSSFLRPTHRRAIISYLLINSNRLALP